jgi:redox-sensitive bicupin YhaK (pirin superfamily)
MITIRKASDRGQTRLSWLDSRHTFSFGNYRDPAHNGVSCLRVINDDRVAPGGGFATHGHDNMEIVTCVLSGSLEHEDSMGNGSVIRAGDVQRMSAGTGVTHSEFNHSQEEEVHFLQIWLIPNRRDVVPAYSQQHFSPEERHRRWRLLVSPDGRDGSIATHQDALLYGTMLDKDETLEHAPGAGRLSWLHVARGSAEVNGEMLEAGDGALLARDVPVIVTGIDNAEILLDDLP